MIAQASLGRRLDGARDPVVLMGLDFGADDQVRATPGDELTALAALLSSRPGSSAEVLVLGKPDGGADELKRTERRAQSVLQFLMKKNVTPERLELGFGLVKWPGVRPEPRVEVRWKAER